MKSLVSYNYKNEKCIRIWDAFEMQSSDEACNVATRRAVFEMQSSDERGVPFTLWLQKARYFLWQNFDLIGHHQQKQNLNV